MSKFTAHRRSTLTALLLFLAVWLPATPGAAEDFTIIDGAREMRQSRRIDGIDSQALLRACLAVLQDSRFHVAESDQAAGLLVADRVGKPGDRTVHTLTISLQGVPGRDDSFQLRLSSVAVAYAAGLHTPPQPDYTDFYQNFFSHLDRELFKERQIP